MTHQTIRHSTLALIITTCLALGFAAACGGKKNALPTNTANPDRYLFDKGSEALKKQKWTDAREYFKQVVDNYPGSPLRPDAKLGLGDTYLGEKSAESLVLAANEYREFITFFPLNPRADYAQYKLAMSHFMQMRAPARDQTETVAALKEFQVFFDRYPGTTSTLTPQVRKDWRVARDRLSQAELLVGISYFRLHWYPGAIPRFRGILKDDPEFTGRDEVYYYLAESLARTDKKPEAIPYFQRVVEEFKTSDRAEDARKRLLELKAQ
ncbi:MAG TPA: outer membrane protein assembly factor BamD [Vicinamibacterales bacterium]|nr:outer membrane protein assembly factor BamD [Vicinamibacterales bacterium]